MQPNRWKQQEIIDLSGIVTMRVDALLSFVRPQISRHRLVSNMVTLLVNDRPAKYSRVLRPHDRVYAVIADRDAPRSLACHLPLDILYEDDALLVIDKPSGIAVHPASGMADDEPTISQGVCFRYPHLLPWQRETHYRAGIVHRLDKETSGALVIAKDERTAAALQAQFRDRSVHKRYVAAVYDHLSPEDGEVSTSIARDPRWRTRFAVATNGKNAHTIYKTLRIFDAYTMVKLFPITGRTHQLRVHLRSIGHPIVDDRLYAPKRARRSPHRLMLHAQRIAFTHPHTGARCVFAAPLPPIFHHALQGRLSIE